MALQHPNPLASLFFNAAALQGFSGGAAGTTPPIPMPFCQQSGCKTVASKGQFCMAHGDGQGQTFVKEGLQLPTCTFHGCSNSSISGGLCTQHHQRLCIVENCFSKATNASIYCNGHEQKCTKRCAVQGCANRLGVEETNPLCYSHRTTSALLNAGSRKRRLSMSSSRDRGAHEGQGQGYAGGEGVVQKMNAKRTWSHPENVFLTGVVFEHLLTDTNQSRLWETVKENYDLAWKRFVALNPASRLELGSRELSELKGQFSSLIAQNAIGGLISFAHLICDWELKFNVNGCLLDFSKLRVSEQRLLEFYAMPSGWSVVDDIFLVAAVVDKFLKTGEIGDDQASWALIKSTFDSYLYVYTICATMASSSCSFVQRDVSALFERFKTLKQFRFVKFCYSQWKSTYQSLVFVTMLQLQANNVSAVKAGLGMNTAAAAVMSGRGNNSSPTAMNVGGMSLSPANVAQNDPAKQASVVKRRRSQQNSLLHLLEEAVKVEDKPRKKARRQESVRSKRERKGNKKDGQRKIKMKERVGSSSSGSHREEEKNGKEKRNRWKEEDEISLWKGIAEHGNSWSAISQVYLPGRTHHQVKDKGKRLLRGEGWITGRSRESSIQACDRAKQIAVRVLGKQGVLKGPGPAAPTEQTTQQRGGHAMKMNLMTTQPVTTRVYPVVTPVRMMDRLGNHRCRHSECECEAGLIACASDVGYGIKRMTNAKDCALMM